MPSGMPGRPSDWGDVVVHSLGRPLARLGVALSAAVIGLSVATAAAVADPAPPQEETTEPAPVETPAAAEPTETTEPSEPTTDEPPAEEPVSEEPTTQEPGTEGPGAEEPVTAAASIQDVEVTATFDKSSYRTGETITMTVTVTNTSADPVTVAADFFAGLEPDGITVDYPPPFGTGPFPLAGGESITHDMTGAMGNPDATTATLYAFVSDETGAARRFTFTVPVTQTFGRAAGTVYVDTNHNESFDDGEGRGGITVTWSNTLHSSSTVTVTTGQDGTFVIDRLPTGRYAVSGGGNGLTTAYQNVTVDESGVDLLLRAYEPLTNLAADLEFTKDTYARDEAPVVRVTLTNSGDFPETGIVARCDRGGFSTSLDGTGPGWGALAGDGVTIPANSTLVLDVTEPMPADAYEYGYVTVGCDFGHRFVEDFEHDPRDFDRAEVPGQRGDVTGRVTGEDGAGVAGARLVIVPDKEGGCPVAETTTDADGAFAFRQLPVGDYMLYLFPPSGFRAKYDNPIRVGVHGTYEGGAYLEVEAGDGPVPTLPCPAGGDGPGTTPPASPPAPAPQGGTTPSSLAQTGASIAGPGILGLLALLTGAVTVRAARRRATA